MLTSPGFFFKEANLLYSVSSVYVRALSVSARICPDKSFYIYVWISKFGKTVSS